MPGRGRLQHCCPGTAAPRGCERGWELGAAGRASPPAGSRRMEAPARERFRVGGEGAGGVGGYKGGNPEILAVWGGRGVVGMEKPSQIIWFNLPAAKVSH